MKQQTLAVNGFDKYSKTTRRAAFLSQTAAVVPWSMLCKEVRPFYPNGGGGSAVRLGVDAAVCGC